MRPLSISKTQKQRILRLHNWAIIGIQQVAHPISEYPTMSKDQGPIFVFASGQRCGSTLLQRFLCSHPQIMIWGEHDGVLAAMFASFQRLIDWQAMFGHQYQTYIQKGYNNFIPNMNPQPEYILKAQRNLLYNLWRDPATDLGCSIWGFKEVLYGAEMALMLKNVFPDARIIHLTRNIFECFISLRHEEYIPPESQPHVPLEQVWTRERTLDFMSTWVRVNQSMLTEPELDQSWVFRLTYERMVECPSETMHAITDWLGIPFLEFDMDVFNHKLYTDRHNGPDQRPTIRRADLSPDEISLVTAPEIMHLSEMLQFDMSVT
jgi:hypothetical protein